MIPKLVLADPPVVEPPKPWPRFWVVDVYSHEIGKTTITTGKLLQQLKAEDVTLRYLCMCGAVHVRVMGEDNELTDQWVAEHRGHNVQAILSMIPEKLRPELCKLHPEQ